jgi:TadE-like protein
VSIQRRRRRIRSPDGGQASAELVAVLPLLVAGLLAIAQLGVVGYSLWSAGTAARAGARAAHVGGDVEAAARSALPQPLRSSARVSASQPVGVRVQAPALLPGLPSIPLRASAELGPAPGGG